MGVPDVAGRDVLILDDILDTGHTLAAVCEKLEMAKPRSLRVCVLLSKRKQRAQDVNSHYVGFEIEDEFVLVTVSISWSAIAIFPTSAC
jgi:hypoxanthine phosphoribosyltransferase